jgi:hypothetical protein
VLPVGALIQLERKVLGNLRACDRRRQASHEEKRSDR